MNDIILIGFMGCGKTSVGRRLARAMNLPFVDMDDRIEANEGKTISEIFAVEGEPYFRELEHRELVKMAESEQRVVLSAGGGLAVQPMNHPVLREMGTVILLEASTDTLVERLKHDQSRPVLQGGSLRERIETLQRERQAAYESVCDYRVSTDVRDFNSIIREIRGLVDDSMKGHQ